MSGGVARVGDWGRSAWERMAGLTLSVAVMRSRRGPERSEDPGRGGRRIDWAIGLVLAFLPLALYWPTIAYHFGFRDDYSILREATEEPGKVFRVCAMQARPIYGYVLEHTFEWAGSIEGLAWIRALSAVMLGTIAAGVFVLLTALRWDRWIAALFAALLIVTPSSQVIVSWAVAWPLCLSLLLALGAFACAEYAFRIASCRSRVGLSWATALILLTGSTLVYQPNALFYFAAVAAALWSRRRWASRSGVEWLVRHLVTVGISLCAAFTVMIVAFARGWIPVSRRVAFEHDAVSKLEWFVREPLQNALGLVIIHSDATEWFVHRFAALVAILIVAGLVRGCWTRGWRHGAWWAAALLAMVFASFAVNLVASDRWPAYRVLLPLTATVTVALAVALLTLGGRWAARLGLLALLLPGLWLARRQTFELFAWPQSMELNLLEAGAARINPATKPRVFVVTPFLEDHVAPTVVLDEFGSLSTNSYWTPKEMLKLIMLERYPEAPELARRYTFACGPSLPKGAAYDVVIDLHRLREYRSLP